VKPLVLAVDTTGDLGSLALARGRELIEEIVLPAPEGFSQILYGAVTGLLARHDVKAREIECFAAASGPGSFTGVRVGLACVKGLAEALGRPAMAVSNLEALARCGTGRLRGAVIDARRGEIYGAVYDDAGQLVSPEVVATYDAWVASLPPGVDEFIWAPRPLAAVIAQIAAERLSRGESPDPASLDANYVRRADAELRWVG
jgi:tRNA threonylcarbamoyladenosine biosynthesis protein TsaB